MGKGVIATYKLTICPNSHFLLSSLIQQTRQPVLSRARSCCLSRGSGKGRRGGDWFSLAAVKSFLVQLHTSSSVGGWRKSDHDLGVVWLESHALRFCVCQQTCVSPGTHLMARQRGEHPAFSSYEAPRQQFCLTLRRLFSPEHLSLSCCRESCTHMQGPLRAFQNAPPVPSAC